MSDEARIRELVRLSRATAKETLAFSPQYIEKSLHWLCANAIESLLAEIKRLKKYDQVPDKVSFWYMFDNHTFKRLHGTSLDAIIAEAAELDMHGMLCSPILSRDGKEIRRPGVSVHNYPEAWARDIGKWKAACEADPDVMRLLAARECVNVEVPEIM